MKYLLLFFVHLSFFTSSIAQSQQGQFIRIMVSPSNDDMVYTINEEVTFKIAVYKFGQLVKDAKISYELGPEMVEPTRKDEMTLPEGLGEIKAGSMRSPGFIRCNISYTENGNTYRNSGTAGIEPYKIQPTTTLPTDFTSFWQKGMVELAKIPLEPVLTLMPEKSTHHTNVYHVQFKNISGHIYGILTMPKKSGKYPAILHVPGAGIRPYHGTNINRNVISLQIGIHGIPVNLYDSPLYQNLSSGGLSNYNKIFLEDKDRYYYKRVYLGCVRAVDFIFSLPEFDGKNLGVMGGSQGGALSIVTASLDQRVKYLVSYYPALSDLTGYLHGRAGGWPHLFKEPWTNQPDKVETSKYYDVVNFARTVDVPGFYSLGFNDNVCPPTSIFSAINVIPGKKEISLYKDASHWQYPEQGAEGIHWMMNKLGVE